jgi:hypothetical protein
MLEAASIGWPARLGNASGVAETWHDGSITTLTSIIADALSAGATEGNAMPLAPRIRSHRAIAGKLPESAPS